MQIIQKAHPGLACAYKVEQLAPVSQILYIDIETTGLSPKTSQLYLIGCAYYDASLCLHTIQWFADSKDEEKAILTACFDYIKAFSYLLHYNGKQFDLPYISHKAEQFALENPLCNFQSIDIYQLIKPLKKLLSLTSLRQKAIEDFLHITRLDQYDGGQLISVYKDYTGSQKETLLKLLLLHNEEDLTGMTKILSILNYASIPDTKLCFIHAEEHPFRDFLGNSQLELLLSFSLDTSIPYPLSTYKEHLFLSCNTKGRLCFRIPIFWGELKHFYADYKNYDYLIQEDCCIHKSLAESVESSYRRRATKETCYTKHTGFFLPQFSALIEPCFQAVYKHKEYFFPYSIEDFTAADWEQYGQHLLKYFCK